MQQVCFVFFPRKTPVMASCFCPPTVTPAPPADCNPSQNSNIQNGPSSSTCDPYNIHAHYSSDNDEDSETDDEALQKEIKRLKEK